MLGIKDEVSRIVKEPNMTDEAKINEITTLCLKLRAGFTLKSCEFIPICPLFEKESHLDKEHDHCNNKGVYRSVHCERYKAIASLLRGDFG